MNNLRQILEQLNFGIYNNGGKLIATRYDKTGSVVIEHEGTVFTINVAKKYIGSQFDVSIPDQLITFLGIKLSVYTTNEFDREGSPYIMVELKWDIPNYDHVVDYLIPNFLVTEEWEEIVKLYIGYLRGKGYDIFCI